MRRYKQKRGNNPARSKVIVFTGGLNDAVTDLEKKPGELQDCKNVAEIDGSSHGYTSVSGYEAFSGIEYSKCGVITNLPSEVPVETIADYQRLTTPWVAVGQAYDVGDEVEASGELFTCLVAHTSGDVGTDPDTTTPGSTTYWNYDGAFVGIDYCENQRVIYGDYVFTCVVAHTVTLGVNQPDATTPGDNTWWTLEVATPLPVWDSVTEYLEDEYVQHPTTGDGYKALQVSLDKEPSGSSLYWLPLTQRAINTYGIDVFKDVNREAFRSTIKAVGEADLCVGSIKELIYYNDVVYAFRQSANPLYDSMYKSTSAGWSLISSTIPIGQDYSYSIGRLSEYNSNTEGLFFVNGGSNVIYYYTESGGLTSFSGDSGVTTSPTSILIYKNRLLVGYPGGHLLFSTVGLFGNTSSTSKIYYNLGTTKFTKGATLTDGTNTATIVNFTVDKGDFASGTAEGIIYLASETGTLSKGVVITDGSGGGGTSTSLSTSTSIWDSAVGAGEIFVGDDFTGMVETVGDAVAIFMRNRTSILTYEGTFSEYGDPLIYRLDSFSKRSGAISNSIQRILGMVLFADDRGLTSLETSDAFGDFAASAISKKVNKYYLAKKNYITSSVIRRDQNQYRLFFGREGLYFTFHEGKLKGATLVEFPDTVNVIAEGEDSFGNINVFFGTPEGYVMKMDSGTSFNGGEITVSGKTSFHHYSTPLNWKRFLSFTMEVNTSTVIELDVRTLYDYEDSRFPRNIYQTLEGAGSGGRWGHSTWGTFVYGGAVTNRLRHYIRGIGTNMCVEFRNSSKYNTPFTLRNMIVNYEVLNKQM